MSNDRELIGILGGLGPIASARFLSSLYRRGNYSIEQEMPRVVMMSDPAFPDRTRAFLSGEKLDLAACTLKAIEALLAAGASRIVFCCYTLHLILPEIPTEMREKVISLVDIALDQVLQRRQKTLLLCTTASAKFGVFRQSKYWDEAKDLLIAPSATDQDIVHETIYKLKVRGAPSEALKRITKVARNYDASSWLFGCTEFHLLSSLRDADVSRNGEVEVIDPLLTLVERLHLGFPRT